MDAQSNYGVGGTFNNKELVPATLRGFRFFRFQFFRNRELGDLTSINRMHRWKPGWNVSDCKLTATRVSPGRCPRMIGMKVDVCGGCTSCVVSVPAHTTLAPERDCTCGFYARYSLLDDSYDTIGVETSNVVGAVEAAGRVIMGSRGFRAEKMRVLAVAPVPYHIRTLWARRWTIAGRTMRGRREFEKTALTDPLRRGLSVRHPDCAVYEEAQKLLEEWKPDDVSGLIGKNPKTHSSEVDALSLLQKYMLGTWTVPGGK